MLYTYATVLPVVVTAALRRKAKGATGRYINDSDLWRAQPSLLLKLREHSKELQSTKISKKTACSICRSVCDSLAAGVSSDTLQDILSAGRINWHHTSRQTDRHSSATHL